MPSKKKLIVNARKLKARKCLDTNSDVHNGTDSEIEVTALQDPRKKKLLCFQILLPVILGLCAYLISLPRFPYGIRPKIDFRAQAGYKMCRLAFTKPLVCHIIKKIE